MSSIVHAADIVHHALNKWSLARGLKKEKIINLSAPEKWFQSLTGGGCLWGALSVGLWLGKVCCFGSVVAYGRYSLMRSGHTWRLNFTLRNQWTYIIHVELKNINIYILYNNTDLVTCLHKKECHSIRLQPPTKLNVFVLCLQLIMTRDLLVFLW